MKKTILLLLLAVAGLIYSCKKEKDAVPSGTAYLDLPANAYDYFGDNTSNNKATLGRVLFYDQHLSLNNAIACASCHKQQFAFADNVALSRGFENKLTKRNSMPIQNLGFGGIFTGGGSGSFGSFFWDGRENNLQNLVSRPITNHVEMGIGDLSELAPKLAALPYYPALFMKAYGTEEITMDKIGESISMFMLSIQSNGTRLDKANMGVATLTAQEQIGRNLFDTKYECSGCHRTEIGGYTGNEFINIGLDYPNVDKGRGGVDNNPASNGLFKIPNLRNVALTAPYMHDGRFKTLNDVLEHYSHNIKNDPNLDSRLRRNGSPLRMNIPETERQALIAFLGTLTDQTMINDIKYSNPFKIQ